MTDLLTLPASDLVARIRELEGENERLNASFERHSVRLATERDHHRTASHAAHNAALEAAAAIADPVSTHVGAAIRGLRR